MTKPSSNKTTITACYLAVRAASPKNAIDARNMARAEFAKRGVVEPSDDTLQTVAELALAKNPVLHGIRLLLGNFAGIANLLVQSSQPRWVSTPAEATWIEWDPKDELFIYPHVGGSATSVFERILKEISEEEDEFDILGKVTFRSVVAWLDLDFHGKVLVHVGKSKIGHLEDVDVRLLRAAPGHTLPGRGEVISVNGILIGSADEGSKFALWLP